MNDTDKRRLARAVEYALKHVTSEAKCYCLLEQPEYLEIKIMLEEKIRELKNKVQPISKEEFKELAHTTSKGGAHIWIKKFDTDFVTTALTDYHDNYGAVAIWCADSEADWLKIEDYGTKWVAYTSEPPEMREEEKAPPHLNGME